VPVAERRAKAHRQMDKLRKQGQAIEPVSIEGRTIARSFWGKGWCGHLESFSDYSNRLPRGRTYVRNGSVCHLVIKAGRLEAFVSGSQLYTVDIRISKLEPDVWADIKRRCAGHIGSMLELLQGRLSDQVMAVVTDRKTGLFPQPGQIKLNCSCPDWATMCKHVAAALYGVGSRLDERPDLLFTLRGVDPGELIDAELALPDTAGADSTTLSDDQLSAIFDVDMDDAAPPAPPSAPRHVAKPKKSSTSRRSKAKTPTPTPTRTARAKFGAKKATRKSTTANKSTAGLRPTGKSIARLRRQLGLSVVQFAEQLGVSALSVYRWESTSGRLNLQRRCLQAVAAMKQTVAHK
jgi:uncharacterized Zn finger protein